MARIRTWNCPDGTCEIPGTSTLSKFGNGWRENGEHYTILSLG